MATNYFESIHEQRRKAPLHYEAKAYNARFVAYLLAVHISDRTLRQAAKKNKYSGTPGIATYEAFRREACLALELAVKAVIAAKIERKCAPKGVAKVPMTHDVPRLWRDAGLPKLSNEDQRRLLYAKSVLNWAGRYAAPRTDEQFYVEQAAIDALEPKTSGTVLSRYPSIGWSDLKRLYSIANKEMWQVLNR